MANFFQSRQAREGGYSFVYIIVFVAILAAANYLSDQHNKTYDLTKDQLYSLSDQTLKILGELETDVTIYHFDRKLEFARAEASLVRYENASGRVSVKYVDPDSDPATAQAMNIRTYGTTLVEVGANREEASTSGEEDVTNAIIKAIKGTSKTACMLTGHGEAGLEDSEREGLAVAKGEIAGANYGTKAVSLLESPEIPADCTVVAVVGPSASYLEPEVEILKNYVESGGRLLLLLDHTMSPELVALAAQWGIEVHDDVVIDISGIGQLFGGSPLTPLVSQYDELHPITKVMRDVATLFPMVRSVTKADSTPSGWSVEELIGTTSSSFATTNLDVKDGELVRHDDAETEGPINIAVAASYDVPKAAGEGAAAEGDEVKQGRVVVVGTSRFARNYFVGRGGNLDLFLNTLSWLVSDEDLISIRPKDPQSTPMDISDAGMRNIFLGLVLGLPLAIILGGVRMWWLRR